MLKLKLVLVILALIFTMAPVAVYAANADDSHSTEISQSDELILEELEWLGIDDVEAEVRRRHENYVNNASSRNNATNEVDYGLTIEEVSLLTEEDWLEVGRLSEINAKNKGIPENGVENNFYAASVIKEISAMRRAENSSENTNLAPETRVNIFGFEVNDVELSLSVSHPIEFTYYASISKKANDKALEVYTESSCWYNGNGDAFRHVSWSALLYCKFYDENNSSHSAAEEHTYMWTNAHEGYQPGETTDPFDESLDLPVRMDLYNNKIGILLASTRIDMNSYDENTIFGRAESWVDEGKAKRIDKINGVDQLVSTYNAEKN